MDNIRITPVTATAVRRLGVAALAALMVMATGWRIADPVRDVAARPALTDSAPRGDTLLLAHMLAAECPRAGYAAQVAYARAALAQLRDPARPDTLSAVLLQADAYPAFAQNPDAPPDAQARRAAAEAMFLEER